MGGADDLSSSYVSDDEAVSDLERLRVIEADDGVVANDGLELAGGDCGSDMELVRRAAADWIRVACCGEGGEHTGTGLPLVGVADHGSSAHRSSSNSGERDGDASSRYRVFD